MGHMMRTLSLLTSSKAWFPPGDKSRFYRQIGYNSFVGCNSFEITFEIVYFLVAGVTFYNFQLTFLFADIMAPFKRYEQLPTAFYVSENFSYPKAFLLFIFFLTPSTST